MTDLEQHAAEDCGRDLSHQALKSNHLDDRKHAHANSCKTCARTLIQDQDAADGGLCARKSTKEGHETIGNTLSEQLLVLVGLFPPVGLRILLIHLLVHDKRCEKSVQVAEHCQVECERKCLQKPTARPDAWEIACEEVADIREGGD